MGVQSVERYLEAAKSGDIDALAETLTEDAELVSPVSAKMVFRGSAELRVLLGVVYSSLRGLKWHEQIYDGSRAVVLGESRVGCVRRHDITLFEMAPDGRIQRIRPYIRPLLALTVDALVVGPRLIPHAPVVWRALRSGP